MQIGLVVAIAVIAVITAAAGLEAAATARDRRRFAPPGRLIDIGGHRLHAILMGEGEPTVVFESGAGNEGSVWTLVQREVAKHTRAVAYDRAGMGWSDSGPTPRTTETYATELRTLLDRSGIGAPYVLVAHSLGGLFANQFASMYPDDVAGMVFVDAGYKATYETLAARSPNMAKRIQRQLRLVPIASALCRLGIARPISRRIFASTLPADIVAAQRSHLGPKLLRAMAEEGRTTFGPALQRTLSQPPRDIPVIVLAHGRATMRIRGQDPDEVEEGWQQLQRDLGGLFANGRYEKVERAGHHIHLDDHETVARAALEIVNAARTGRDIGPEAVWSDC
jgi:pimeloyl-ACP methyl ester carboxylesterase